MRVREVRVLAWRNWKTEFAIYRDEEDWLGQIMEESEEFGIGYTEFETSVRNLSENVR